MTLTFSAAVTGFAVDEIEVTEGAASNFSGSGTVYEIEVTPEADYAGDVTVTVAADGGGDVRGGQQRGGQRVGARSAFEVDAKVSGAGDGGGDTVTGNGAGADGPGGDERRRSRRWRSERPFPTKDAFAVTPHGSRRR